MAEATFTSVKVVGRFGITVADAADADDHPDVIWCDEGRIILEPLIAEAKFLVGGQPWTGGNSAVTAYLDSSGNVTWNGKQFIEVIDLTQPNVTPSIPADAATHRVRFVDVKAQGLPVAFAARSLRIAADTLNADGVCDLTELLPVPVNNGVPIVVGPQGVGVASLAVESGDLVVEYTDGTTEVAGELPVGPGGSDAGVASYISGVGTATEAALKAKTVSKSELLVNVKDFGAIGDDVADDTAAFVAAISSARTRGIPVFIPKGTFKVTAPIELGSGTALWGVSPATSRIRSAHNGATFTTSTPGVRTYNWNVQGLTLLGPGRTVAEASGLDLDSVSTSAFRDVVVSGYGKGVRMRSTWSPEGQPTVGGGCVYNDFHNVTVSLAGTAWSVEPNGSNSNRMWGCRVNVADVGVSILDSNQNVWIGGQIEGAGIGYRVAASGPALADNNEVLGTRFENNTKNWEIATHARFTRLVHPAVVTAIGTSTDEGLASVILDLRSGSKESTVVPGATAWTYERTAANPTAPMKVTREMGSNAAAIIERWLYGTTVLVDLLASGTTRFGPVTSLPTGLVGKPRGLATSTEEGGAISWALYVNEGANNRRAETFLDDTTGEMGMAGTASSGSLAYVVKLLGQNQLAVGSDGKIRARTAVEIGDGVTAGPKWTTGSGTPEAAVAAPPGSIYTNTAGGVGTTLWVKRTGTGNTGWFAVA